jgi:Ca-activated chloride channel family protein
MKDASGGIVMSKLDERSLTEIASLSGGRYVRSVTGDLDLDLLYFAGIKTATTASELGTKKIQGFEERFQAFTLAACILILLEWAIPGRREAEES